MTCTEVVQQQTVSLQRLSLLTDLLACPHCHADLKHAGEQYACLRCQGTYPVINGIPRFITTLSKAEQQVRRSFDLEQGRYEDSRHLWFRPELVQQWLDDVRLPRSYFKGKVVLDAGCGSGRWTYALAHLGATVIAVDFTDSGVQVTDRATRDMPHVAVLQANILSLPFKSERFDFVVSWGVLHHTPNTKAAFDRLVPLVNRNGSLYVMVYEKHNYWKFVWTDLIRRIFRLFSETHRYRLCRVLIIRNRKLHAFLAKWIICMPYPPSADPLDVSTAQLGLYDAYAPRFNHLHTWREVQSWFEEHKFRDVTLTKPVRFTTKTDVLRNGECGGSINVRGVRT